GYSKSSPMLRSPARPSRVTSRPRPPGLAASDGAPAQYTGRRMKRLAIVLALAAVVAPVLSGCTKHHESPEPEGQPVEVNGLSYTSYITRQLNLRDPEDHDYYQGPEAPPGFEYMGVFITVCNDVNHTHGWASTPVNNFRIIDTTNRQFSPIPLPASNIFS